MKRALITGITGQDGSYLAEILLAKDYEVHGLIRRTSTPSTSRIAHLIEQDAIFNRRLFLHSGDLIDQTSLQNAIIAAKPDEIYNFAAMSHVGTSFKQPETTMEITGYGFLRLLDATNFFAPEAKIYQASSSEMFGRVQETPQTERTQFYPRSPYGAAKAFAFHLGRARREAIGETKMRVYNGILFNHESPRRGEEFLSKKVVKAAARIKRGEQDKLYLGNLEAKRDWGYAKEYSEWIWRIVQHPTPDDFLIATGETHTVEEFVAETFALLGMKWREKVVIDPAFLRPAEVDLLQGDASKSRRILGFEPKVRFRQLVEIMVRAEMDGGDLRIAA